MLLSATDSAGVVAACRRIPGSERISFILEGESLFNDATAIVLFGILMAMVVMPAADPSWSQAAIRFIRVCLGGIAIGVATALVIYAVTRALRQATLTALLTIAAAYLSFLLAERMMHFSGVIAVLVCGIVLGSLHRQADFLAGGEFTGDLWGFIAYVANAAIFLLAGVTVTLAMFEQRWLAMLIGLLAATIARVLSVYSALGLVNFLPGICPMSEGIQTGVACAASSRWPSLCPYRSNSFTIQSMAYGVVLFSLFVQAPLMPALLLKVV